MVGGFLMAAAGVGVFGAYAVTTAEPTTRYLVTTRDIAAGERFTDRDVAEVALDLPEPQTDVALRAVSLSQVVGGVATSSLVAGELLHRSDVANPEGGADRAQISIAVPAANAFGGTVTLGPNDLVDVIVTYASGASAETATVSRGALVVTTVGGGGSIGSSGSITVVLAVRPDELEAVARAASAGDVTLARVTGVAGRDGGSAPGEPQPAPPPGDAEPPVEPEPEPAPEPPPAPEPEPASPEDAAAPSSEPPPPPPPASEPAPPTPEPPAPGEPG